jgi:hypothetical protein
MAFFQRTPRDRRENLTKLFPGIPTLFQNLSSHLTANIVRVGLDNKRHHQLQLKCRATCVAFVAAH